MELNPSELKGRLEALERQIGTLRTEVADGSSLLAGQTPVTPPPTSYGNQNYLRNGNLDLDRNRYLYLVDYVGSPPDVTPPGIDADVSEEAAFWFVHPRDVAVESTGSIAAASPNLVIDDALFVTADNGATIVIEGAGTGGADLVTTISGDPSTSTDVLLADAAVVGVTGARIRWRLQLFHETTTDMDSFALDSYSVGSTFIEARTSDPGSPINGQTWLRLDL